MGRLLTRRVVIYVSNVSTTVIIRGLAFAVKSGSFLAVFRAIQKRGVLLMPSAAAVRAGTAGCDWLVWLERLRSRHSVLISTLACDAAIGSLKWR